MKWGEEEREREEGEVHGGMRILERRLKITINENRGGGEVEKICRSIGGR